LEPAGRGDLEGRPGGDGLEEASDGVVALRNGEDCGGLVSFVRDVGIGTEDASNWVIFMFPSGPSRRGSAEWFHCLSTPCSGQRPNPAARS